MPTLAIAASASPLVHSPLGNQLLIQQPGGRALNAIFAANHLALFDG